MSTTALSHPVTSPAASRAARLVDGLIAGQGRAGVANISPAAFAGRNHTWVMTLADSSRIFVKQFIVTASSPQAFARSVAFDSFAADFPGHAPDSPRLLARDPADGLLVFDYAPGQSLAHLVVDQQLPAGFAAQAGRLVARLHRAPATGLHRTDASVPALDQLRHGIPRPRYLDFTLAEIRLWAQLQRDTELIQALTRLAEDTAGHREVPIHGDLRLDQFHQDGDRLLLLDWEDFGRGDPARDLGTLAGEWLYRAILDTVTSRGDGLAPPEHFDQENATTLIAARMGAVTPQIHAFWASYRRHRPHEDPALGLRATARLGWHLVDRAMARAAMVSKLSGIERAALGIGRKALLDPAKYQSALGFGEVPHDDN